jgi:hypothetical protein
VSATPLPPGITIGATPQGLLDDDHDDEDATPDWRMSPWRDQEKHDVERTEFPSLCNTSTPAELTAKLFGCSGSIDSQRYAAATKFRDMPGMDWATARVALNRLVAAIKDYHRLATNLNYVALAEFTLTARDFDFQGLKGEQAPRFRK